MKQQPKITYTTHKCQPSEYRNLPDKSPIRSTSIDQISQIQSGTTHPPKHQRNYTFPETSKILNSNDNTDIIHIMNNDNDIASDGNMDIDVNKFSLGFKLDISNIEKEKVLSQEHGKTALGIKGRNNTASPNSKGSRKNNSKQVWDSVNLAEGKSTSSQNIPDFENDCDGSKKQNVIPRRFARDARLSFSKFKEFDREQNFFVSHNVLPQLNSAKDSGEYLPEVSAGNINISNLVITEEEDCQNIVLHENSSKIDHNYLNSSNYDS